MTSSRRLRSAPPGYAPEPRPSGSFVTALELFIPAVSLLLAFDQLLVVQPELYLHGGVGPTKALMRLLVLCCAIGGWFTPRMHCALGMLVASVGVAASGPMQFWAFSHGSAAVYAAALPSLLASMGLGVMIRHVPKSIAVRLDVENIARTLLQPFVALALVSVLCAGAVISNALGPVRSSLAVAGGLASAAVLSTASRSACQWRFRTALLLRRLGYAALGTYALCAALTERRLPLHLVMSSSHPVVFHVESERCKLDVSSGQGAYHLFVDGELRFSTFDERRWADVLVRPALARVRQPKRAMVLSTGEGLIERELLKDPGIESVTSVVRCRLTPDFVRQSAWMRQLTLDAMNSPRVALVERDPAAYLTAVVAERFDLVIVDLPDPSGPKESKYYSRFFYQQLAARMRPGAVLVAQATSARRSPKTFATIGATLRAAGFTVQPAIVPLISRGEWSLYLAAIGPLPEPMRPEWMHGSLAATIPVQFSKPWPDTLAPADFVAQPSTLHDASVLDWFERELDSDNAPPPLPPVARGNG